MPGENRVILYGWPSSSLSKNLATLIYDFILEITAGAFGEYEKSSQWLGKNHFLANIGGP